MSETGIEEYEQFATATAHYQAIRESYEAEVNDQVGALVDNFTGRIGADDVCKLQGGRLAELILRPGLLAMRGDDVVLRCTAPDMPRDLRIAASNEMWARHAKSMQPWVTDKAQGDL